MGVAGCPGIPGRIKSVWVAGSPRNMQLSGGRNKNHHPALRIAFAASAFLCVAKLSRTAPVPDESSGTSTLNDVWCVQRWDLGWNLRHHHDPKEFAIDKKQGTEILRCQSMTAQMVISPTPSGRHGSQTGPIFATRR
jgi:hypothetical protein